jgi:hypothetical protein
LTASKKAGYGALRQPAGNDVSPLWEWLRATIIAARCRSHRKKNQLHWKANLGAP